jgi:hypothetical protein
MEKTLVASKLQVNRLDAHEASKWRKMRLASHKLLDEALRKGAISYHVWAREFLVYPPPKRPFNNDGKDIFDKFSQVCLPWEFVRELDIFRPNVGLFVDPEHIFPRADGALVLVPSPNSIIVLENFIQTGHKWVQGIQDEETGIPLESRSPLTHKTMDKRMWFLRAPDLGAKPILRVSNWLISDPEMGEVNAIESPDYFHEVAFEAEASQLELAIQ